MPEWREFAFVAPGQLFILMFIRNGFLVCAHASYANFSIFAPRATCNFGFCIIRGTHDFLYTHYVLGLYLCGTFRRTGSQMNVIFGLGKLLMRHTRASAGTDLRPISTEAMRQRLSIWTARQMIHIKQSSRLRSNLKRVKFH